MNTNLPEIYIQHGAVLAGDGIPLHFGQIEAEYEAALVSAVLLDRSHEGRLELQGEDRFAMPQRISTNDVVGLTPGEGKPTLFLNANGRILDRAELFNWREATALLLAGPGRGPTVQAYLQRNIFFNDKITLRDLAPEMHQFSLHGPQASTVLERLYPGVSGLPLMHGLWISLDDLDLYAIRSKPLIGDHWTILTPREQAHIVWETLRQAGHTAGLHPSGGIIYNALRIRAGQPGTGRELSPDYIPLEVGLWDEVSFTKGCYTGQEIIARMESRNRLAKTLVRLELSSMVDAPAELTFMGRPAGMLTSSVTSPAGEYFAIGVVKTSLAHPGTSLSVGAGQVIVQERLGVQPLLVQEETE